jgi:cell wall-associated NlpC family hydrolase
MGCGLLVLLVLAGFLLGTLGGIDQAGAGAQRAADMAALAAGHVLADNPGAGPERLRQAAAAAAQANGGRLVGLALVRDRGLPAGVEVTVAGGAHDQPVTARARAAVTYAATLPAQSFRPVDLHGMRGRGAVIAAAAAQVGWPYVWGGESRAEGGFDCSGLVDFAFTAAGGSMPGRPTAAGLWQITQPISAEQLQPGDLVFVGTAGGAPHHVGIYVGDGTVLSAPHSGADVGYSPLAGGGWDGYGRLLPPDAGLAPDPVEQAARRHGVPGHVLAAELELGLAADADLAAAGLARAQVRHPGSLEQALTEQLGSASDAALVLRRGSGPALALDGAVRLRPMPHADSGADAGGRPVPAAPLLMPRDRRLPRSNGQSWLGHLSTALSIGERAALQLGERGRALPLQAVAGIQHLSRFTLIGLGALLPDPDWRDAANLVGSGWDAASAVGDLVAAAGSSGLELSGVGLWAARFSVIGGALSAGLFASQAYRARRSRDRIGYGLMAAGSVATTAGLATAGSSLLALGATASVVPPLGLTLMAVGAGLCVSGYLVRHPEWCRRAIGLGGRVLDTAWRVETAPVRVAASLGGHAAAAARSVISSIPTPW